MPSYEVFEGTDLLLEEGEVEVATKWSDEAKGSTVTRVGKLVFLAMQVKNAASAGTTVCTLPEDLRPAAAFTTPDGKFTVSTAGVVKATYSVSSEAAGYQALNAFYVAATIK
jgi:hypothetical protein